MKGARVPRSLPPRVWPISPATDTAKATLIAPTLHHPLIGQPFNMYGIAHDESIFKIP